MSKELMDPNVEDALERRRIQNRMAQRRFRRNQRLQNSVDWTEVKEDAYNSMYLDLQSQGLSSGDAYLSPGPYPNSSINSAVRCLDTLASSHGHDLLLDDISFLEHSSAVSTQDRDPTFSSLQTSPSSPTVVEQFSNSVPNSSPMNHSLVPLGSFTGTAQGSYSLSPSTPSDCSSTPSVRSPCGWLSPLHIAAQKGHDRIARILLQHNIDCNEKDSDGLTPIAHAAIGGHEDVVRSLLLHGARIGNVDGQLRPSALHWAVLHRRETSLRVLLNHCSEEKALIDSYDDVGRTPLHIAIDTDFETGVLMLLQFGANPQGKARKP
ncbi:hypothetical protein MMC26_005526 [Xylographa opegraphella]|nr:hypothetical protein [Xylographa opegraphella]